MFNIVYAVIASKDFELSDITNKINTLWIQSKITDEEKDELIKYAKENANPENSYAPLQEQIDNLFKELELLKQTVNENAKGTSAIKEAVEKLGGYIVSPEPEPVEEYPEYVQPTGAHDAYHTGDKITYKNNKYICKINNCVWDPDTYPEGWELVV